MTHPHDDHYRGMSHLLAELNIDCFWFPAAMCGKQLKWIIKAERADATKSGIKKLKDDADELQRIFTLVREKKQLRGKPAIPKRSTIGTTLFPVPLNSSAEFQVVALAPSGFQIEKYERDLRKCFDLNGTFANSLAQSSHNIISMALLIIYGKTRIILGGDVESEGWRDVLNEFGADNLCAHAVKVSHHGSTNGYTDGLWDAFSQRNKPIAFVTAYRSKNLPRRDAIEHIRTHVARLSTPCLPAIHADEIPVPLAANSSVASRKALRDKFNAMSLQQYPVGCCRFVFDNHGNCDNEQFGGRAGYIPT